MKGKIILISFLFAFNSSIGQTLISNQILDKVFKISMDTLKGSATGFLIEDSSEIYIVTARHIFPQSFPSDTFIRLYVAEKEKWNYMDGTLFHHQNENVDISIIRVFEGQTTNIKNNFKITVKNLLYGDEGYILGFPYNLSSRIESRTFPVPLIKKVINSAIINDNGAQIILLDGHNNPGFSGGPVIFKDYTSKEKYVEWQIVGVISGYVTQNNEIATRLGTLKYQENSGIIISYGSDHIKSMIRNSRL